MNTPKTRFQRKTMVPIALFVMAGLIGTQRVHAQFTNQDYACSYGAEYSIVWDGFVGKLTLKPDPYSSGNYLEAGGQRYAVRYGVANPQDFIDGQQGPGYRGKNWTLRHRIVFWVDFNRTPYNYNDDQRFDGYLMTQTRNAIAGATWWDGQVFGFFARNKLCIPG